MEAKQEEWVIYVTTNLAHPNKKVYVGQMCIKNNSKDKYYKGSGTILKKAFKKWGIKNFHREILVYCYSQEETDFEEVYWIKQLDARNPEVGYNLSEGGYGGGAEKQYRAVRCIDTDKVYDSIQEASKDTGANASCIGQCCSGKAIKSGGLRWQYIDNPIETKKPFTENQIKVICINTSQIFNSVSEAARSINVDPTNISSVCKGISLSIKGLCFRYLNDVNFVQKFSKGVKKIKCLYDNKIFNSIREAAIFYNTTGVNISNILKGKYFSKKGLKFEQLFET